MRFCRDVPVFVEVGEAGIAVECYAASAFVFNSLGNVLGLMSCKRSSENGRVLVGFQSTEAFGCLHHAGGGPAQRHRGVSPSLHVATDARNRAISGRDEPRVVLLPAATAAK